MGVPQGRQAKLHTSRQAGGERFAESFNGRLRDECLNINWFMSIKHAREVIESWRQDYNEVRPHSSLKGRSPKEYAEAVECSCY